MCAWLPPLLRLLPMPNAQTDAATNQVNEAERRRAIAERDTDNVKTKLKSQASDFMQEKADWELDKKSLQLNCDEHLQSAKKIEQELKDTEDKVNLMQREGKTASISVVSHQKQMNDYKELCQATLQRNNDEWTSIMADATRDIDSRDA